jgi:hypothetical protein
MLLWEPVKLRDLLSQHCFLDWCVQDFLLELPPFPRSAAPLGFVRMPSSSAAGGASASADALFGSGQEQVRHAFIQLLLFGSGQEQATRPLNQLLRMRSLAVGRNTSAGSPFPRP